MRFILAVLLASAPTWASAGLIVTVENTQLPFSTATQTGSFEVYVQSSESVAPQLTNFQVALTRANTAINFTGAETPATHPYALNLVGSLFGASVSNGGATITGSDSGFSSSQELVDGAGLLKVNYSVAAGLAPGSYVLSIDPSPNATFLANAFSGNLANVTFQNGMITIVPEPTSIVLLLMGMLSLGAINGWRRCRIG